MQEVESQTKYVSKWNDIGKRKKLTDKVSELGQTEHIQILRLVQEHGIKYTTNNNGVFCDITKASDSLLDKIEQFIEFAQKSSQMLAKKRHIPPVQVSEPGPPPKEESPAPRTDKVKAFAASLVKTKTDSCAAKRKEACRYQQIRKKYSRPVNTKTAFQNELGYE